MCAGSRIVKAVVDRDVDAVAIKRWIKGLNCRPTVGIGQSHHASSMAVGRPMRAVGVQYNITERGQEAL